MWCICDEHISVAVYVLWKSDTLPLCDACVELSLYVSNDLIYVSSVLVFDCVI